MNLSKYLSCRKRFRSRGITHCTRAVTILSTAAFMLSCSINCDTATAQTFYIVDTLTDFPSGQSPPVDGQISLREAVVAATTNQACGDAPAGSPDQLDTIKILVTGTINLVGGELVCSGRTNIYGPGADDLTIDAGNMSRIFRFEHQTGEWNAWQQIQTVRDIRMINGQTRGDGGAIWHETHLTLDQVEISTCTAHRGGAIYCLCQDDQSSMTSLVNGLNFYSSTAAENISAAYGGAIYSDGPDFALVAIINSTFGKNVAGGGGGAIAIDLGNIELTSLFQGLYIASSTIVDNSCSVDDVYATGDYSGGVGVYNLKPGLFYNGFTTRNSVFARNVNFRTSLPADVDADAMSPAYQRSNFVGAAPPNFGLVDGVDGNQIGTASSPLNPGLTALGWYGGSTRTMRPFWTSPLKNAGNNTDVNSNNIQKDQRGYNRIRFGTVDIGSVER